MVEPPGGLPPVDREFYMMQGDFYPQGGYNEPGVQSFDLQKLLHGITIEGWASVMAVVLLYGGLSLFFNGVIAIYVAKIFIEVKRRPRTIVREVMGATKIRGDAADG